MRGPSSPEQETLDELFRKARAEPRADDLRRVKSRLHGLAMTSAAPRNGWGIGGFMACLAVVGFGAILAPRDIVTAFGGSAPAHTVTPATPPPTLDEGLAQAAPERAVAPAPVVERAPVVPAARAIAADEGASTRSPQPARVLTTTPHASETAQGRSVPATTPNAPHERAAAEETNPQKESEASFLRRAKVALASDPALALRLTDAHPSDYPRGVLVQEREVIAIGALARLGRASEAHARAAAFRSSFPTSGYRGHLDETIERQLGGATNDAPR